jgi:tRNA threonylcarbamoyladenosine biosynthesis protein TsaE
LLILETRTQIWPNEAACAACAGILAGCPALHNAYIELHGTLGAGKTTWARYLLHAMGVEGRVKSPTYAVMEAYVLQTRYTTVHISHFDFYRFNDPQEWEDAGFRDVFASPGLKLAEWPDKAAGLLPQADLRIYFDTAFKPAFETTHQPQLDAQRQVRFTAHTALGLELLP